MNITFRISALLIGLYITVFTSGCSDDDTATEAKDFPREGLVAYYPFNGNANDESDESNNGSVNGATLTTDRYGNANKAYAFDGTDDYIDCGNDASLQITTSITICAWVNHTGSGTDLSIVSKYTNGTGYNFALSDDLFRWNIEGIADITSSGSGVGFGTFKDQWSFLAATYNGYISEVYRNGTLIAYNPTAGSIKNADINLTIGKLSGSTLYPFSGSIDDVMIYNRALSADEITEVYNQTTTK